MNGQASVVEQREFSARVSRLVLERWILEMICTQIRFMKGERVEENNGDDRNLVVKFCAIQIIPFKNVAYNWSGLNWLPTLRRFCNGCALSGRCRSILYWTFVKIILFTVWNRLKWFVIQYCPIEFTCGKQSGESSAFASGLHCRADSQRNNRRTVRETAVEIVEETIAEILREMFAEHCSG